MNRNQFTFYKSFDDTFDILDDKQTLKYLKTLRDVQFLRIKIQDVSFDDKLLNGIWQSTKHTLSTSIKGYLDSQLSSKVSNPFFGCYDGYSKDEDPFVPPLDTPSLGGQMQVKGKVKSKVEDKEQENNKPTLEDFEDYGREVSEKYNKDEIHCLNQVRLAFTAYTENGWRDAHDKPVKIWKTKLMSGYLKLDKLPDAKPTPIVLTKEQELKDIEEWIAVPENHEFKGTDPYDTEKVKKFLTYTAGNQSHHFLKQKLKRHLELTGRL